MLNLRSVRATQRGFSLVELMIALVAGLIVIGSVLAFTVSTIRAYDENIRSARLTQDLRTAMNLAVREIRRSGYDATSVTRVLTDNNPAPSFAGIAVSGDCITYQYDRGGSLQNRALRRNSTTGTLQAKVSNTAVSCGDTSGWVDVSDPSVVEVTRFQVLQRSYPFCTVLSVDNTDPANPTYDKATGSVRNVSVCIKGRLRADSSLVRTVADTSRSRAEDVQFLTAQPTPCGTPTADALGTPAALNSACGAL